MWRNGSARALGARGCGFEPRRPDHTAPSGGRRPLISRFANIPLRESHILLSQRGAGFAERHAGRRARRLPSIAAYRWIFSELPPQLRKAAERIQTLDAPGRWNGGYEAAIHRPVRRHPDGGPDSVAAIVSLLLARNLPPTRLAEVLPEPRRGEPTTCLNRACRAPAEFIRRNGARNGRWETYCAWCGSRFLGDRIICSFDYEHGDPRLSIKTVRHARARLALWRQAIEHAAAELRTTRDADADIRIEEVFARSRVPDSGYVHARRLGLRRIAKAALSGDAYPDYYAGLPRWRHPAPKPPEDGRGRHGHSVQPRAERAPHRRMAPRASLDRPGRGHEGDGGVRRRPEGERGAMSAVEGRCQD